MARLRDLKNRIQSVRNTKKITKTMEMVATAKSKRAQDALKRSRGFGEGIRAAIALVEVEAEDPHPLSRPGRGGAAGVWLLSANRGLCGGFNAAVVRLARETAAGLERQGKRVRFWVQGKKGQVALRGAGIPFAPLAVTIDDRPAFPEAEAFADEWIRLFLAAELESLTVVSTRIRSAGVQAPEARPILPIRPPSGGGDAAGAPILDPDPASLCETAYRMAAAVEVHQALLESAAAEQIARRIAMKNATDNADEMITFLTRSYNRARQAGITQEIAEIVGGAEAIK